MPTIQPPRRPSFTEEAFDDDSAPSTQSKIAAPVSSARHERAVLVMLSGLNAGQVFRIEGAITVLGRSKRADVFIDDAGVSRKNTRVVREGGAYFVEDMGSRNGTYKNGERVARAELKSGDRVHVSQTVAFRFAVMDEAEEVLAKQLYEASTRDALTRAYNRRYFNERLAAEIAFAQRHKTKLGVILMDVDHFKRVNDTYGHRAGDDVLHTLAVTIQSTIRAEDVFARYGGEEFVVLVRGVDHGGLAALGERLRSAVARLEIPVVGARLKVTISVGVASLGAPATMDELIAQADERLYRAKASGRDRVVP